VYDVTPPISSELPVWPGDPRPHRRRLAQLRTGDPVTLSEWTLGSHTGAHVDAPAHFLPNGSYLEEVSLSTLIGPSLVLDLTREPFAIGMSELDRALGSRPQERAERVLLKTRNSLHVWAREPFRTDSAGLTLDGAQYLIDRGVRLVGADYLSVESFASVEAGAPVHHALLSAGMVIVEGLMLAEVPAGAYFLIALPLRLEGSEAAPARVILLERTELAWEIGR
jgi:arylformamidase